jgi:hypothetical protein
VVVEIVQARYTVAGDVASFDKAAFKAKLAAQLDGVSEADISLEVSAASIKITASIVAPAAKQSATVAALTALAADTSAASTALGVTVEAASTPFVTQIMVAPPSHPAGLSQGALIGIVVAAVVVALVVAACVVCRLKGRGPGAKPPTATKEQDGIVYRGSVVPPPPPATDDVASAHKADTALTTDKV